MEKKERRLMHDPMTFLQASKQLTTVEKIGQFFMPAAFINDSEQEIVTLENLIIKHQIGGLCFFHSRASAATNFEGKKEVVYNEESFETLKTLIQRYQKLSKYPLLISIDAEWGLAMRVENTPRYPYAITLGAIQNNDELLYKLGQQIANDCKAAGVHWNFSPVADINNNPNNPVIGYRSFGEDKYKVATKANAFANGLKSEGVLNSVKHFPGHGDTGTDSHLGLPVIDKSLEELLQNELYPFIELIKNGVDSVMVGHLAVPQLTQGKQVPASVSKEIIQGILREELGFKNVIVSDALNMYAVSRLFPKKGDLEWAAFDAGNDVLCFAENLPEGIETILKMASISQIEDSFERVWQLKQKAIFTAGNSTATGLINPETLNKELAYQSLSMYNGSEEGIGQFKREGFTGIEISRVHDIHFFKSLQKDISFKFYSTSRQPLEEIKKLLEEEDNVLLSLFPPKIKPHNNFDITDEEIRFIGELLEHKNVVIYLFGNPYVLNILNVEKARAVVLTYQNFDVFQDNAAQHFIGNVEAKGKLPVTIEKATA